MTLTQPSLEKFFKVLRNIQCLSVYPSLSLITQLPHQAALYKISKFIFTHTILSLGRTLEIFYTEETKTQRSKVTS
jgi:hypothetical protein